MSSYARNPVTEDIQTWLSSVRAWFAKRRYTRAERYVLKLFAKTGARIRADEQRAAAQAMIVSLEEEGVRPMSREGKSKLEKLVREFVRDKTPLARRPGAPAVTRIGRDAERSLATVGSEAKRFEETGLAPTKARKLAEKQIAVRDARIKRSERKLEKVRSDDKIARERRVEEAERGRRGPVDRGGVGPPARRTDTRPDRARARAALGPVKVTSARAAAEKTFDETKDQASRPAPRVFDRRRALGPSGTSSTAIARRQAGAQTLARRADQAMEEKGIAVQGSVTEADIQTASERYGEGGAQALVKELVEEAEPCEMFGREGGLCFEFLDGLPAFFIDLDWEARSSSLVHIPSAFRYSEFGARYWPPAVLATPDSVVDAIALAKVAAEIFGPEIHQPLTEPTLRLLSAILQSKSLETWMQDLRPRDLYSAFDAAATEPQSIREAFAEQIARSQIGLTNAFLLLTRDHGPRLEELLWVPFLAHPELTYLEMLTDEQADIAMRSPQIRQVSGFDGRMAKVLETRRLQLEGWLLERYEDAVRDLLRQNLDLLAQNAEEAAIDWRELASRELVIDELAMEDAFAEAESSLEWVGSTEFDRLFYQDGLAFEEIAGRFMPGHRNHREQVTAFVGGKSTLPEVLRRGMIGDFARAVDIFFDLSGATLATSAISENLGMIDAELAQDYENWVGEVNGRLAHVMTLGTDLTGKQYEVNDLPDPEDIRNFAEQALAPDFNRLVEETAEAFDVKLEDSDDYDRMVEIVIEGDVWNDMMWDAMATERYSALVEWERSVEHLFTYDLPFTSYEFASFHIFEDGDAGDAEDAIALSSLLGQVLALMGARGLDSRQFDYIPEEAEEVLDQLSFLRPDDKDVPDLAFEFLRKISEGI